MTEHQQVITYTIRDGDGMMRDRGIASEGAARAPAAHIVENTSLPVKLTIERVTYVSQTTREVIAAIGSAE